MQTPKSSSTARKRAAPSSSMSSSRSIRSSSHHSRTSSRSSSHQAAVPVAAPFDPAVEENEIAALTSSIILPPSISEPPLPSAAPSPLPTPRLRFETFHSKVDYRYDGDRWMDTDAMLAKRRKLKSDEAITRWINVFWRTFHHKEKEEDSKTPEEQQSSEGTPAAGGGTTVREGGEGSGGVSGAATARDSIAEASPAADDDDPFAAKPEAPSTASSSNEPSATSSTTGPPVLQGTIDRRQYMSVHKLWFKALHKPYDRSDAQTQAIKDWARDSWLSSQSSSSLLDYPAFVDALFELVDLWTLTIEPTEYVHFLATLYHRVTRVKSWLGDNGEIITKYVWRKTKYVKPSAVYRPFQYNKYKDVKWKEAGDVIHHLDSDDSSEEEDEEAGEEEEEDDALIRDLQALSEDEAPSSPELSSDDSEEEEDDEEEVEPPQSARSTKTPTALSPKGVVSPVTVSNPMSRHRSNVSSVPLLAIDPAAIARSLADVDIEPPMSPYLDPPAVIPQTPGGEEDEESDEEDEERRLRRARRSSAEGDDGLPSSSASELDEDDPLISPTSLQQQARYDSAMDILAQQQHDRYLLLVANLKTMLESQQRRLRRSNSTVLFSVSGTLTKDVDASLAEVGYEMDELGGGGSDADSRAGVGGRLEEREGGILRARTRRFSRTEPIGCLVDVDGDERYMKLRGDGKRRNSAPYNVGSFSCAGPRVYKEETGPSRNGSRGANKSREAPTIEVDEEANEEEKDGEEEMNEDVQAAAEVSTQPKEGERPPSTEMAQEDFAVYIASLDQPKHPSPRADDELQLTIDGSGASPLHSHMSLASIQSQSASPRHIDSAPVMVPPATAEISTPSTEQTAAGETGEVDSLNAAARKRKSTMKPAPPVNNPPSPVFAQSKQRMSVSDGPIKAGSAAGKRKSRERRDSQQTPGQSPTPAKRPSIAATPKSRTHSVVTPNAASLTSIDESNQPLTDMAAEAADDEEKPMTPGEQFADAAHRMVAGRRGTAKAVQKLVDIRDKRLADMEGAKIRDEALAAEYDEEALRRRQLKSANLRQLKEIEDEDSRAQTAAELDEDDKTAREGEEDRRRDALRRKKDAEERRKKEEEERKRKKEEDDRKAAEDKAATVKAEKEMASLLHEADSQRKVEQQLKAQKRELVSAEKANRRKKERDERARQAEEEHKVEVANKEAERGARAAELAARKAAVADDKQSKKAGKRSSVVDSQTAPADDADDEADDDSSNKKKGAADAKKDTAAAGQQGNAVAERKARLAEEAKARQEALKERQEAEEKAAAETRGKADKKVLKAKAVKKSGKGEDSSAVVTEDEGEGKTRTRADFMRARKLDRKEGDDDGQTAQEWDEDEQQTAGKGEGKGWGKGKGRDDRKGKKSGKDEAIEQMDAETDGAGGQDADKAKAAANGRKGKQINNSGTTEQEAQQTGTPKAKGSKGGKSPVATNDKQVKHAAHKAGDGGTGSGSDESTTSSHGPSDGSLSTSTSQLSTARTNRTKPTSSSILSPRSAAAKVLADEQAKAERLQKRRTVKRQQAQQDEATLAAEQSKYTYGADWTTEQKQAYREAELAKEKAEEKATLLASGENGLLELKWAQKMEDIKRKQDRAREREEKDKQVKELDKQKRERERERAEERSKKEEEKREKAREKQEREAQRKAEVEQRKEAEKAEKEAKLQEKGQKEAGKEEAGKGKGASTTRAAKPTRRGKGELATAGEDGAEVENDGSESGLASGELSKNAAIESSADSPQATGSEAAAVQPGNDPTDAAAPVSLSTVDGTSSSARHPAGSRGAPSPHAAKFAVKPPMEPKVIESTASTVKPAQSTTKTETDPRKMAAAKRREEAARRIEDMKKLREEQILQQAAKPPSILGADEQEAELPIDGQVVEARKSGVAEGSSQQQSSAGTPSSQSRSPVQRRVLHSREREVRVVEDGSTAVYEQPKDGEVKYWTRISQQDGIVSPRHKADAEHAVKVVEDPSANGLSSTPGDIEKELQLLRKPQRQWGMALSKEEAGGDDEKGAAGDTLPSAAQHDEEVKNWETARQRPPSSSAPSAAGGLLALPGGAPEPNGALSARGISTPRVTQQPHPEPLVRETPEMVRLHSPPQRPSLLALHAEQQQQSADSLGFDLPSHQRAAADSLSVHKAATALHPQPNPASLHEAEVHSRRHHMAELTDTALHSLAVHSDAAITEANARRWLLMEEVRSHAKEREEQRRQRVEGQHSHDSEAKVEERQRAEAQRAEWDTKKRQLQQVSEAFRQERSERRAKRRQEKERRRMQRDEDAATLKAMREDILREKEQRRVRKRQEREALAAARLQLKKAKEDEVDRRRRQEDERVLAERTAQEKERMEQEKKKEREKRIREEEKAVQLDRVREMEEQLRQERVRQKKEEKEKARTEKEEAKKEEMRGRVLAALKEVDEANRTRAQQRANEEQEREEGRRVRETRQEREVRDRKVVLHTELAQWWQRRRERNERLEREHRRQVLEEEELRREEVTVLRTHKQRANSSSSSSSSAATSLLPSIVMPSDKEMHDVRIVADGRRDDRLRVEMNARRALEKLMTQHSFNRYHSLPAKSALDRPSDSSRLPPLLPSQAFTGEEEKTALTIEPARHSSTESEDEAADSFPTVTAFSFEHPSDTDLRYRKVPLIVQGNPSRHTGISWRIKEAKLRAERIVGGVSPILPPAMVKRVRGREADGAVGGFGSTVGRDGREREEKESKEAVVSMWGNVGEDLSLVGKKQRAFLKKKRKSVATTHSLPPLHKVATAQKMRSAEDDIGRTPVVNETSEPEVEMGDAEANVQPVEEEETDSRMGDEKVHQEVEQAERQAEGDAPLVEQAATEKSELLVTEAADADAGDEANMQASDAGLDSPTEDDVGGDETVSTLGDGQHVQETVTAM